MAGPDEIRLFVYGTLLFGERDHALLAGAAPLGAVRTRGAYTLVDLGVYPVLLAHGTVAVSGELYVVTRKLRFTLDVRQQVPVLFQRIRVELEDGTEAETYGMREDQVRGKRRLSAGDWRKRFAPKARPDRAGALVRAARDRFRPR